MTTPPCYRCGKQPCECKDSTTLYCGDCVEVMQAMPANSVDAIVTDPPYGLEFMGKEWDKLDDAGRDRHKAIQSSSQAMQAWHYAWAREVLRVCKPGAHLLAFGGTRTFHRLAVAIEDAGWEIRDCVMWVYGSGFPKSHDVSKAIDKAGGNRAGFAEFRDAVKDAMRRNNVSRKSLESALGNYMLSHYLTAGSQPAVPNYRDYVVIRDRVGLGDAFDDLFAPEAEREVVGQHSTDMGGLGGQRLGQKGGDITAPATPAARQWAGWGTALKPAWEPIIVARKPLAGTVAENVLKWGTGALNIDGCRVGTDIVGARARTASEAGKTNMLGVNAAVEFDGKPTQGRWPANIILTYPEDLYTLRNSVTPEQLRELAEWMDANPEL